MAGVMSLMQPQGQQGPMPGQAQQQPMQGMMPQQGAPTPGAMTSQLKNIPLEQLRMFLMNPQPNSPPLWAVISAVAEKQKEAQAMQAAQGQQVMAQNAQMQQQPPVAAQVMQAAEQMPQQQTQMAAHGGIMHGYAGGGAVSFKYAGYVPPREEGESFEDYRQRVMRFQEQKLAEEKTEARRKTQEYYAGELAARKGLARPSPFTGQGQQVDASKLFPFGPPESPMMDVPEIQVAPSSAPAPSPAGSRRQPMAGPAPAAPSTQPALTPSSGLSPEMEEYYRNRASELRTRQGIPEDVASGRAGLEALARENIAAQRGEAETFGREARERRDAALARSQRGILDDPQALLTLAGSIDTRKGQGIGSLARGAAGLLGQREASAEAARKEYATSQQTERALQANVRQSTMLEAQRAQALREGDFNRANQIKDQIDALMMQRETLLMERKDKAIEQQRLSRGLDIQERGVRAQEISAGKPSGEIALMQWLQDPKNRKMYEELQSSKRAEDRNLKLYEIYTKNKLMLGNMSFEDFAAGLKDATSAAGAGAGEFKILSSRPK